MNNPTSASAIAKMDALRLPIEEANNATVYALALLPDQEIELTCPRQVIDEDSEATAIKIKDGAVFLVFANRKTVLLGDKLSAGINDSLDMCELCLFVILESVCANNLAETE